MNSFSEQSFGARLLKAQSLLQLIQGFNGYAPPNTQDTATAFGTLLADISEANDKETDREITYKKAVKARQDAFWNTGNSIQKLLSPIRAAVEAQYMKGSHEYQRVMEQIHIIRSHKGISNKVTPATAAAAPAGGTSTTNETAEQTKTSSSEQSYGSIHRHFADLVLTLQKLPGYNPSNTQLKPVTLQARVAALEALHTDVINYFNTLRDERLGRQGLYDDMLTRTKRIKAYVQAQYGNTSPEYAAVLGVDL